MSKAAELLKRLEEMAVDRNGPADTGVGYPEGQDAGKVDGVYPNSPDMRKDRVMGHIRDVSYRK